MDEIKVVPYIPDEDYDNPAMVVDFYEFTMANCLFLHGFKDTTLVFDMFFRKTPDNQGYSISAGQRKLTRFLLNYHFNAQDIWWLRTKGMSEEFCEYLRTYQWKGDMYALPEGTVAYPHVRGSKLKALAVAGAARNQRLASTPTLAELNVKGVELTSWGGVSAPKGTPDAIVSKVRAAFERALAQPSVIAAVEKNGGQVSVSDEAAYVRGFNDEIKFTEAMMKKIGLQPT